VARWKALPEPSFLGVPDQSATSCGTFVCAARARTRGLSVSAELHLTRLDRGSRVTWERASQFSKQRRMVGLERTTTSLSAPGVSPVGVPGGVSFIIAFGVTRR